MGRRRAFIPEIGSQWCAGVRACGFLLLGSLVACSQGSQNIKECSKVSSLMRFDRSEIDVSKVENIESFLSNGGFIEVFSRKDIIGPIDSRRLCTALVEFTDNPAVPVVESPDAPLKLKIYTANHCLDLSRDFQIKLHLFDGQIYQDFWLENETLAKVTELRKTMRRSGASLDLQRQVLSAFSVRKASIEEFFGSATVQTSGEGTGASNTAGEYCLKKDDPNFQNVCATFQDMTVIRAVPSVNSPSAVLNKLRAMRTVANKRAIRWVSETKLAQILRANVGVTVTFQDKKDEPHDLTSLHGEVRRRVLRYAQFKNMMNVNEQLLEGLLRCAVGKGGELCQMIPAIAGIVKAELSGTGYEDFADEKLLYTVDALKSAYNEAFNQVDKAFTVFDSFIKVTTDGGLQVGLTARVHSNFRFVTLAEGTTDRPDPKDSLASGRGFMHFNTNNMTADVSGGGVSFISWVSSESNPSSALQGRFLHMKFPRNLTTEASEKQGEGGEKHIGYMQEGDSGSIVVIEQLPYFAITSVDGSATSGGAGLRPLPEPIDEADIESLRRVPAVDADATGSRVEAKPTSPVDACR